MSSGSEKPKYTLNVRVKQARNLPLFERSGTQSSVFSISFQGWHARSKVFDNSLNPAYDENFSFPLGKVGILSSEWISIIVRTYKTEGASKLLGKANKVIPVEELKIGKVVNSVMLMTDKSGNPNGGTIEVALSAQFQPVDKILKKIRAAKPINPRLLPDTPDLYKLRFLIHKCTGLAQTPCSAIVVVKFGAETKSTQICELTQDPEFEEEINFVVIMSQKDIAKGPIIMEVLNTLRTEKAAMVGEFKFVVETGFIGKPIGWQEPGYEANTVCRTMVKKWVILTDPFEQPKNIKGFLNVSFSVLSPSESLAASPAISPIVLNVVDNIMRPSEVTAQYKKVYFRAFMAHELPVMDVMDSRGQEHNLTRAAYCDPILTISYCGVEIGTQIHYATYDPQFNTDIIFNIEIPAVTDVVVIKILDYDTDSFHGPATIATKYLSLSEISHNASKEEESGFDPTFGPAHMPFYGAPKQCGMSALVHLNTGEKPGVGYRGRLLLEVFTKPSYSVGVFATTAPTPVNAIKQVTQVLRTQKCVLAMGVKQATMIPEEFGKGKEVQFEISVGEFGNQNSNTNKITNSLIWPEIPAFDSKKYYYIDYENDQACIIPMEWENILYRLHHLNILEDIHEAYKVALDVINDGVQKEKMANEIVADIKIMLRKTIDACSIELPELPSRANELDKKLRDLRVFKLAGIVQESKGFLRGGKLDSSNQTVSALNVIGRTIKNLCKEPQNEIPNITIYMYMGDVPVAYFTSPINPFLESAVGKGRYCNRNRYFQLTPLDGRDIVAAELSVFVWFGTEADYKNIFQFPYDGRASSYAEMYENEMITNERWGIRNLPRPHFSNRRGTMETPKEFFEAPEGWSWEREWEIEPMKSSLVTDDFVLKKWTDNRYEAMDASDPDGDVWLWFNQDMSPTSPKDQAKLTEGWEWTSEWEVDMDEPGDTNGWSYSESSDSTNYFYSEKKGCKFKRRLWKRDRIRMGAPVLPDIKEVVAEKGGWEYAQTFSSRFEIEEHSTDMVRRRRWTRTLTNIEPYALTFVKKTVDDEQTIAPPLVIKYPASVRHEVRVHIFQGRTLNSPDIMGYVTVYCVVCVNNKTQITRTVEHQLSPTWDETLIFEDIFVIGPANALKFTRPKVTIELYHKGPQGDVFLGRSHILPVVDTNETRMSWFPVENKGENAGDILGLAQIFPADTSEDIKALPFDPPKLADGKFQLPPGIRPIMKLTRIEILSWGLRKLRHWNAKPIISPVIEIECGGFTTVLQDIVNVKVNPNFPRTSCYIDVLLPEGNTYKPPINIRLLDKRENGFNPLIGKYVLTQHGKFDPDCLAKQLKLQEKSEKMADEEDCSLYTPSVESTLSTDDTVVIIEDERDGQTGCMACLSKMVKITKALFSEVLDETDDWEFLSMYWWSRYYAMEGNPLLYKTLKHHELPMIVVYEKEIEHFFNNFADSIQQFKLQTVAKVKETETDEDLEKNPVIGVYKGSFRIYEVEENDTKPLLYADVPTSKPLRVIIRTYCLQGIQLACNSPIKDRYCDAYIHLQIGPKRIKDVGSLVRKTRNPRFCKIYNMETILPTSVELSVSLYDFEATEEKMDSLIGETKIDIEDRFLSIKRPICSLTERYMVNGPHKWRDFMLPTQILDEFCVASGIALPAYGSEGDTCIIAGEQYTLSEFEKYKENFEDKKVWGPSKERVALYVLLEMGLIRDHVEKRNLYNPVLPGVSQGRLLMWCDIFPWMESPPEPMNIDPPLPVEMELRVIVYDCVDVATIEEDPPKDAKADSLHDLVIKSQFVGEKEADVSEIHTRAINGNGAFNWRYIHQYKYAYLERKVIIPNDVEDAKFDPKVTISVCDADPSIAPLPYGSVSLNLANCPRGAKSASACTMEMIEGYKKPPEVLLEEEKNGTSKKTPPKITYLSVYKKKKTLGWWPIYVKRQGYLYQTGMVSMELEVMTKAQAAKRPAGPGRSDPNTNPIIDEPIRIPTTFPEIDSKVKMVKFIWKSPNKPKLILGAIAQVVGGLAVGFMLNASGMVQDLIGSLTGGATGGNSTAA